MASSTIAVGAEEYRGAVGDFTSALMKTREGRLAAVVTVLLLILISIGAFYQPYRPTAIVSTPEIGSAPSLMHPLGLDALGRDVLSRFLAGGRTVVAAPILSIALAYLFGATLGIAGSLSRSGLATLISRAFDFAMSVPTYLVILVIVASFGVSRTVLVVTVALVFTPWVGRMSMAAASAVVRLDYVEAAKARGESSLWIVLHEVWPNIQGPMFAAFALDLTSAIAIMTTLSYLGLGSQPPSPEWGLMVAESQGFLRVNPLAALIPAAGIGLLSVSLTLWADAATRVVARDSAAERIEI